MSENTIEDNIDWKMIAKLEALLFVSPELSDLDQLSSALKISETKVVELLNVLDEHYKAYHGIRLQNKNKKYQLTSPPEYAELVEEFLGLEMTTRLSQAALEALTIIAYKQPTTRPEIDSIRGVNSDAVVKSLLSKGMIEELGRTEAVGRPILYGVTSEFMQHFGLESLDQLPVIDFEALNQNVNENGEDKRILKG
ncbi:MAG: SMC-Scp complex subunit ScpB [Anaerolineaceae bacterium]|nr:SMC-Scp complex subunit ScpB [Anaerolineaceae bacterium]